MLRRIARFCVMAGMVSSLFSCNYPGRDLPPTAPVERPSLVVETTPITVPASEKTNPSGGGIHPEDLQYLGAFRLPEGSGGSNWEYSGQGLTYYPGGDPAGPQDGFPGSLFGFGHDHHLQVSEISIPVPIISRDLADLNTAATLQPFSDISGGIFNPPQMTIPIAGIAFLAQPQPGLHFTFGQHIQDFEASHGWCRLDLGHSQAVGPWFFDRYTNYITNDYLFDIPPAWTDANLPGALLAGGRAREGLWSGRGPALFAYNPWENGHLPEAGSTLSVVPLLLYGIQDDGIPDIRSDESMGVVDYREADHWWGGAWLTAGDRAAVVFVGTKAWGVDWYGYANGVVWEHDCAEDDSCPEVPEWPYENRGFWAEGYQAQIIFYDPAQLAAVARGEIQTWEPQPFATLVLDEFLFDPQLDHANYKRDLVGATAFDREHGLLYVVERLADEYKSVIHVWQVNE